MKGIKLLDRFTSPLPFDVYEHKKANSEYTSKTLAELFELLEEVYTPSPNEEVDHDRWVEITAVISERFRFARSQDIDKVIRTILNEMIEKQNELIKAFVMHRHDKKKSYSEKPVW